MGYKEWEGCEGWYMRERFVGGIRGVGYEGVKGGWVARVGE